MENSRKDKLPDELTDKDILTIRAYIKTINPISRIGNISEAIKTDGTLSQVHARNLIKQENINDLIEAVQIRDYVQSIALCDQEKTDLIRSLELMTKGYCELINPLTGHLDLIQLKPADILKATTQLADLRGWKDAKQVNVTHDITGFLNKVSSKQFRLPVKRVNNGTIESINLKN